MFTLIQDLKYGLRMLTKNPGFTAVAVVTLALGIGVNTAIFSLLDAVVNLRFPIKDQNQIVNLWASNESYGPRNSLSIPDFLDYRKQNRVFEDLAAYSLETFHLTHATEPQRVGGNRVSFNYFSLLGVQPAIGRNFLPEESEAGKARVVILSHGLWQGTFGADPAILGKSITLDRESYTVIGVMPAGFRLFNSIGDLWVPLDLSSSELSRGARQVMVVGRLKSGVSKGQAQTEMSNLACGLAQAFPSTNKGWDTKVVLLQDEIDKRLEGGLVLIMAPVVLVLLIACANVANLLLARASVREKEMGVRAAMGAGRLRLIRQLLTESALFTLLAGGLGISLGIWGMSILRSLFAASINSNPHLDARVLGFALLLCLLTPLLFGLAPAFYATRLNLNEILKEGKRGSRAGGSHRLREYLVVSEVGFAVALLGLSGLLLRLFLLVGNPKPTFDSRNLLTMTISLPEASYPKDRDVAGFYRRALEGFQSISGVGSIGVTDRPPRSLLSEYRMALRPIDIASGPGAEVRASAIVSNVSPGYFSTLEISLRHGRSLIDEDAVGAPRVGVINESLARLWGGADPIGMRLRVVSSSSEQPWISVVGVVADIISNHLGAALPGVYLPCAQNPKRAMTFVIRTLTPPLGLEQPLKRELWALDRDQSMEDVRTIEQLKSDEFAGQRAMVEMVVAFAVLALVLASTGVYSVMSYIVAQRTQELGVRMSLGARPRDIVQLVMKEAMPLVTGGVVIGLAGAYAFGCLLGHELTATGIRPYDPITFSWVSLLLMLAAFMACYLPTRRAVRVEPVVALRYE
ncbi:MAG: ABC transporter permease [Acidobacteriota bacterium]|nr:ABC transporter permease [Acidobacteriota bacterium]